MITAFHNVHRAPASPKRHAVPRHKRNLSPYAPAAGIVFVLALPLAGEPGLLIAYGALIFWMFRGARQTVEALCLLVIIGNPNPGLFPAESSLTLSLLRWIAILAAFGLSVTRIKHRFPSALKWAYLFAATASLTSTVSSYALDVSLFKVTAFALGITAITLSVQQAHCTVDHWRRWFLTLFAIIVVIGFPLLFSDVGYVKNGRGFQGILAHPQAYAVFLAPGLSWLIVSIFTRELKSPLWYGVAALAFVSLAATLARTGLAAFILGTGAALLVTLFSGPWRRAGKHVFETSILAALIALPLALWQYDWLAAKATELISKGNDVSSLQDAYAGSRGHLLQASIDDFTSNPLVGIGFGVASNPWEFVIERDPLIGLPISAATEKGNIYAAVLGETGLIGTAAFAALILSILATAKRRGSAALAVAITALLTNFGEAILLSISGLGLYLWLIIGVSSAPAARVTNRYVPRRPPHRARQSR